MRINVRSVVADALLLSVPLATLAGVATWTLDRGVRYQTPEHNVTVTTSAPTLTLRMAERRGPAEDSEHFNCKRHGNRSCGVQFDATPNNDNPAVQRYVIVFDRNGKPVDVVPYGKAPLHTRH